jgi:hypothetical protein
MRLELRRIFETDFRYLALASRPREILVISLRRLHNNASLIRTSSTGGVRPRQLCILLWVLLDVR